MVVAMEVPILDYVAIVIALIRALSILIFFDKLAKQDFLKR
jgi:hypothetical protein